MTGRRWALVVAGIVAIAIIAIVAVSISRFSKGDTHAKVVAVAFSPDRSVVGAKVDQYYSGSCTRAHPEVERDGTTWRVKVMIEQTSNMCTMEMCVDHDADPVTGSTLVPFTVPDDAKAPDIGCKSYAIRLDEPAPATVRLVPG